MRGERFSGLRNFRPYQGSTKSHPKKEFLDKRISTGGRASIFVSNFPEDWKERDIYEWLSKYGRIFDVFIPNKRTKKGRTFAFVDFVGVHNIASLANHIDKMWIGLRKIRANVSRQISSAVINQVVRFPINHSSRRDNRKFAEVVKKNPEFQSGKTVEFNANRKGQSTSSRDCKHLTCSTTEKDLVWAKSCLVGKSDLIASEIRKEILDGGYFGVKVSSLRQNKFILHYENPTSLERLKKDNVDWLGKLFSSLKKWDKSDVASRRNVWINVYELQLHLWNINSYKTISSSVGTLIEVDKATQMKTDLSKVRLLVESNQWDFISQITRVVGEIDEYQIRMVEDSSGGWASNPVSLSDMSESEIDSSEYSSWSEGVVSDDHSGIFPSSEEESRLGEGVPTSSKKRSLKASIDCSNILCDLTLQNPKGGNNSLIISEEGENTSSEKPKSSSGKEYEEVVKESFNDEMGTSNFNDIEIVNSDKECSKTVLGLAQETVKMDSMESQMEPDIKEPIGSLSPRMDNLKTDDNIGSGKGEEVHSDSKSTTVSDPFKLKSLIEIAMKKMPKQPKIPKAKKKAMSRREESKKWNFFWPILKTRERRKRSGMEKTRYDIARCNLSFWKRNLEKEAHAICEMVQADLCHFIWGGKECDWWFKGSIGSSGGILSIWDTNVFTKSIGWDEEGAIGVEGYWGQDKIKVGIINVYAPCDQYKRCRLWEKITARIQKSSESIWCVCGDFNEITCGSERKGKSRKLETRTMKEFTNFISENNLQDIPMMTSQSEIVENMKIMNQQLAEIAMTLSQLSANIMTTFPRQSAMTVPLVAEEVMSASIGSGLSLPDGLIEMVPATLSSFDHKDSIGANQQCELHHTTPTPTPGAEMKVLAWAVMEEEEGRDLSLEKLSQDLSFYTRLTGSPTEMKQTKTVDSYVSVLVLPDSAARATTNSSALILLTDLLREQDQAHLFQPWGQEVRRKYTWYRDDGSCCSRLDRFLLSQKWLDVWPNSTQKGLDRSFSDHVPISLTLDSPIYWGPRPFRSIDWWLENNEFKLIVKSSWEKPGIVGWGAFLLQEKLKRLKKEIKAWAEKDKNNTSVVMAENHNKLAKLDEKLEQSKWSQKEVKERLSLLESLKENSLKRDRLNFQRSRSKWLKEGDANSTFFHNTLKIRRKAISEFHENASFAKGVNSSFITLIPKVKNPISIREFRPISLIGGLYKIIAKLLASRMAKVVESIISPCQFAFVNRRNILESNIIVNEVVDEAQKRKNSIFLIKIDFEKAYDSIDHAFLFEILIAFGFDKKWCSWMKCFLLSASTSILINGSPTAEFLMEKGLRQGDPMSPFLFIFAAECLGMMVRKAIERGCFQQVRVGKKETEISVLQFADDTLFIGEANDQNILTLKGILRMFELWSGLKVNYNKSSIYGVNVNEKVLGEWSMFLNCKCGSLPFNFLGLKVGASFNHFKNWDDVGNKLDSRIKSWNSKYLSFGGRMVLANAVLNSIPTYYISTHKLPIGVCRKFRSKIRKFLWGGNDVFGKKISWVSWEKLSTNKDNGGLGILELDYFNKALLSKWGWCLLERSGSALWLNILESKYGNLNVCLEILEGNKKLKKSWSPWWKNLIKVLKENNWFFNNSIRDVKPFTSGDDVWKWTPSSTGQFTVKSAYKVIREMNVKISSSRPWLSPIWVKGDPLKVTTFSWKLVQDRIPTISNLIKRGAFNPNFDKRCKFCGADEENSKHLFFECTWARKIWDNVYMWVWCP
ncbi:hypothetical protein CASFOL_026299 [Castilleja foliolosa]|uniref:Reverse transcriptase domain-containing protein n=1 Tax=Castilleja foliolosa TaxID=1961234 RepID=A0ABD3CN15_9LAMI